MTYSYSNIQTKQLGPKRITHKVIIKNNNGHKSITIFKNGKHIKTVKKKISKKHINLIKCKKFIKGLFNECKTRKNK